MNSSPTTANFAALQTEFGEQLVSTPGTSTAGLSMNLTHSILSEPLVRLAIAQSTDRVTMNSNLLQDANIATTTWMPPSVAGLDCVAIDCFPDVGFDQQGAKKNLAKAGYPDGEGLPTFQYMTVAIPENERISEFLQ